MNITGICTALIVGAIIGALGRLFVPGRQPIGFWLTIAVGVVAALVGTVLATAIGVGTTQGFDWIELIFQIALATIGVALVTSLVRRRM